MKIVVSHDHRPAGISSFELQYRSPLEEVAVEGILPKIALQAPFQVIARARLLGTFSECAEELLELLKQTLQQDPATSEFSIEVVGELSPGVVT
ncbi:MAG: hypothetical protein Q7S63_02395 [bacterium]|nr:hypothetical protein [bacterium]